MNVREIMTKDVITVTPDAPLEQVATSLIEHRISGLPVIEDGRVLGIVSEQDLLFKEQEVEHHHVLTMMFNPPDPQIARKHAARTAGEIMTSPVVTIGPETTMSDAARQMTEFEINRLPVVEDGELIGIVTRTDIVGAFLTRSGDDTAADRTRVAATTG